MSRTWKSRSWPAGTPPQMRPRTPMRQSTTTLRRKPPRATGHGIRSFGAGYPFGSQCQTQQAHGVDSIGSYSFRSQYHTRHMFVGYAFDNDASDGRVQSRDALDEHAFAGYCGKEPSAFGGQHQTRYTHDEPSSADFDPSSVRPDELYFEELIAPRHKLYVAISFDGHIWVGHESVKDSHLLAPFLSRHPRWMRFWAEGTAQDRLCQPATDARLQHPRHGR